jgi:predicted ATPase
MTLELKNIGMIKEATVKIDGLTVIAGENDTGKSTVARELYRKSTKAIFIDTPNSLDTFSFIKNATLLIHREQLNIHLARFRVDLILLLSQDIIEDNMNNNIYKDIEKLIDGRVYYNKSRDEILYEKYSLENKIIKMENTSNGIKMFGFLQMLILNGTIQEGSILILDEPEVHLHPKWQLKYAQIVVTLVKNGVRVLVNSHSPYMIEALELYAKKTKINHNFYLAEKKDEYAIISDVTSNLEPIYAKLAKPIQTLEEQSLENFEW